MRRLCCISAILVMPSGYASPARTETSLISRRIVRDGKPGLANCVDCVAASASLGITERSGGPGEDPKSRLFHSGREHRLKMRTLLFAGNHAHINILEP